MAHDSICEALSFCINWHEQTPTAFVVNRLAWMREGKRRWNVSYPVEEFEGVPVIRDDDWPDDKVGTFYEQGLAGNYRTLRDRGAEPREALRDEGGGLVGHAITSKLRISEDDGDGYRFITEPVDPSGWEQEDEGSEEIVIRLRPEFAVYALSSLEVIREVLDEHTGPDDNLNTKSRVAALEILCRELAKGLDEQASRDRIDSIIDELIERYR